MLGQLDVSRETRLILQRYFDLVIRWNRKINIVGTSMVEGFIPRHVAEAQTLLSAGRGGRWLDMGSGAGLPGVFLAVMGREDTIVTLIESDARKCEFLYAARRKIGVQFEIFHGRVEDMPAHQADVVTARAFAPLKDLVRHARRHSDDTTSQRYLKGHRWPQEERNLRKDWIYDLVVTSVNQSTGSVVLDLRNVREI